MAEEAMNFRHFVAQPGANRTLGWEIYLLVEVEPISNRFAELLDAVSKRTPNVRRKRTTNTG
jgi:hypothetical protein